MNTWFVLLILVSAGTILLSYRRSAGVEAKVERVQREFQRLGENLDELKTGVQGSTDQLRKEIYDKLTYKTKA